VAVLPVMAILAGLGGYLGAHFSRKVNQRVMRWTVAIIGFATAGYFLSAELPGTSVRRSLQSPFFRQDDDIRVLRLSCASLKSSNQVHLIERRKRWYPLKSLCSLAGSLSKAARHSLCPQSECRNAF